MRLIFLYGPPGVGKLTVGKELAKITGYKLFHNHLTVDLVQSVFERGTEPFSDLIDKYRLEIIGEAAKNNVNLIFTFVYAKLHDDKFVREISKRVEKYKGKVVFVQLKCSEDKLHKRLRHSSRKRFSKIKKFKTLKELMGKYDIHSPITKVKSLVIDNTKKSPKKAALDIKNYFKLRN